MAELTSTRCRRARIADFSGAATIVFYESRGHTAANEDLKQRWGKASERMGSRLTVLGIANLRGFGGAARKLVSGAVKAIAAGYGVELWMDFDGAFALEDGAHVIVLAPDGRELFYGCGALDAAQRARCDDAVRQALREVDARAA
jgi:hypothetical protein